MVIAVGVCAALHVGKLPPALDVLRAEFGLGLAEAGLLLSMVQLAGMTVGLLFGAWIDAMGSRRSLCLGLGLLTMASVSAAFVQAAPGLMVWRAVESVGFLLCVLAAPPWVRELSGPTQRQRMMALWGTYMPLGMAMGLLFGSSWIAAWGWRSWWVAVGAATAASAALLAWRVPRDRVALIDTTSACARPMTGAWHHRLLETLHHRGPWLVAMCFAVYSSQWLAVVGFLPSMYAQLGLSASIAGLLTALVCLANVVGNVLGASLLHRGHRAPVLIASGFVVMAFGSAAAFVNVDGAPLPLAWRLAAVLTFSLVGGLIPSSLFALSTHVAPSERTMGSTVGWMQQWSALGQFSGPPTVGWLAGVMGGWQLTWVPSAVLSAAGLALAVALARHPRVRAPKLAS